MLGANDGVLSTASVIVGVAAANPGAHAVLLAGVAALTAGAMSMAAGEYVSVSSQADTEAADLAREAAEQQADPRGEARELAAIYIKRGLIPRLLVSDSSGDSQSGGNLIQHRNLWEDCDGVGGWASG